MTNVIELQLSSVKAHNTISADERYHAALRRIYFVYDHHTLGFHFISR